MPPLGLLAVNPSDRPAFALLAKQWRLQRQRLFHAELHAGERFFLAGPAVGAPMATLCLEKLIALGARRVVLYGWCGSLVPDVRVGDLLLPTEALSEEGTSAHYQPTPAPLADALHGLLISGLTALGHSVRLGAIWTTDAFYRETREKVADYGRRGILAVDMEYAALRTVAAFRGIFLAAVMLVSDELVAPVWHPAHDQATFRRRSRNVLSQLASLLNSVDDQHS